MNIFIKHIKHPKILGIINALKETNHNIIQWDNNTDIFNIFEYKNPDIIFISEKDINLIDYIRYDYPNVKIYLFKNSNDTYEVDKEINIVDNASDNFIEYLFDEKLYSNGIENHKYKCDFLIISDNISNEQNYILDICSGIGSNFNTKIYGLNKVNSVYYLGIPERNEYKNIIASCKAMIMFDDEWFYTALFNNKIPLIYDKDPMHHFQFNNYNQLFQMCDYISKSNDVNSNLNIKNKTYSYYIKEKLGII